MAVAILGGHALACVVSTFLSRALQVSQLLHTVMLYLTLWELGMRGRVSRPGTGGGTLLLEPLAADRLVLERELARVVGGEFRSR